MSDETQIILTTVVQNLFGAAMEVRRCFFLLFALIHFVVDAAPRGSSVERKLRGQRVPVGRGGSATRLGVKNTVKREPLIATPPDLPLALSDHTATAFGGLIYIAGGCDSLNGNELVSGSFACLSISDKFFTLDPTAFTGQYTFLQDLPGARYRHSSIGINNQIWLVGGRDVQDTILTTVDVGISCDR
jgi:hypothetical protein